MGKHERALALVVAGSLLAAGCASAPTTQPAPYQVSASTSPPPSLPTAAGGSLAATPADNTGAPPLALAQPTIVGMPSTRLNITAKGEDLSAVISRMATQVGLTAVIDPAVRGPVTRTLQNVSLNEAMQSLVGNQFRYQVQNGTLVVSPISLVQHTYTVDYLTMSRIAQGSTIVNRGTTGGTQTQNSSIVAGTTGTGTGVSQSAGGLVASGADVIQSSSNTDVWTELSIQLVRILFGAGMDSTGRAPVPANVGLRGFAFTSPTGVSLGISPTTSLVDVVATPDKQEEVTRYLGLFNSAITRQVSIKAQVVEVRLDRTHQTGIDWQAVITTARRSGLVSTNPNAFVTDPNSTVSSTGTASFNLGFGDVTVQAVLKALETVGNVAIVATPSANAMNQQKSSFSVTRQQQFVTITQVPVTNPNTGAIVSFQPTTQIQTATVGLVFDVLPQISDRNIVQMAIRPSLTTLVSRDVVQGANGVQATLPVIDSREVDTMARIRSGETIMIGGLIQKQNTTDKSGIPVLKDIPLIGRLFSSTKIEEHTSELVIFLTPEIVSGQPPGGR